MPQIKLICDRCGEVLDDKDAIELALQGTDSWHAFIRERGEEPRGLFPCKNWIRCHGEMIISDGKETKRGGNGHKRDLR